MMSEPTEAMRARARLIDAMFAATDDLPEDIGRALDAVLANPDDVLRLLGMEQVGVVEETIFNWRDEAVAIRVEVDEPYDVDVPVFAAVPEPSEGETE